MKKISLLCCIALAFIGAYYLINKTRTPDNIVYNMHEHIQSKKQLPKFLEAMDNMDIGKTVLVGSPKETIYGGTGFTKYKRNNDVVLEIAKTYPDRFIFFPTVGIEENAIDIVKEYIKKGGKGIKLYNGHYDSFYKTMGPLNRKELLPVYAYAEKNNLPIIFHTNPYHENIKNEFIDILTKYPNLKINCPHFCLSSINTTRFEALMDAHPNLYTDISFGSFAEDGLKRISKDPEKFKKLINKYPDRFLFGSDTVITDNKRKTVQWYTSLIGCYKDLLEKDTYTCAVEPDFTETFSGLALDEEIRKKIYTTNAQTFLGI
ncbi:MAG: amidohydrolase family protein [Candidatus Magasanikbacteria bacterium]|jgi:predicted TIM-barrel fold metal-dependent hydrolase|nr:amidohydrolase family protein [Candidatus Magasanikbacteria bacterium]MBT5820222.1 amidohydrolase family protein [Candidatus Magasanikbacteria bacterium]MBT6294793.1 amidohydrolase family protein [Candidatus Magasanikbacteria bacterium]